MAFTLLTVDMALTAKETADIEAAMADFMEKRRPPVKIRDRLDLA